MNSPDLAPCKPARVQLAILRSVLFRIRNNQDYAEEIVIPKLLHQVP